MRVAELLADLTLLKTIPSADALAILSPTTSLPPSSTTSPATTTTPSIPATPSAATSPASTADTDPDTTRAHQFLALRQVELSQSSFSQSSLLAKRAAVARVLRRIDGESLSDEDEDESDGDEFVDGEEGGDKDEEEDDIGSAWGSSNGAGGPVRMAGAWGR